METFVDELAEATGMDAVEFRRKHMQQFPRAVAVLNAVAVLAGPNLPRLASIVA